MTSPTPTPTPTPDPSNTPIEKLVAPLPEDDHAVVDLLALPDTDTTDGPAVA